MKTFYTFLLPVMVLATLSFSSCKPETSDEPDRPTSDSSAVDKGSWDLDARMDTTIRPGDDFDMYCNGTWWQSAGTGDNGIASFFETDLLELGQQYILDVMESPIAKGLAVLGKTAMDNPDPCAARMAQVVDMVNDASSVEELWHVTGRLMKAGYKTPFQLACLASHGSMCPTFTASSGSEFLGTEEEAEKVIQRAKSRSPRGALRVLTDEHRETPKPIAETAWPMFSALCSELGLDPTITYTINDIGEQADWDLMEDPQIFYKLQEMDVETLRAEVLRWLDMDRACYDSTMYADGSTARRMVLLSAGGLMPLTPLFTNYLNYTSSYYLAQTRGWTAAQGATLKQVCDEMRDVYRERIEANTWISEAGKRNIIDKLNNMQSHVLVPNRWMENGVAQIDTCTTLLNAVLTIRANHYAFVRSLQGLPRAEGAFHALIDAYMALSSINACYSGNYNGMFILPVMCSQKLYDPVANMALNYGHFAVICHEIGHGFDSSGLKYGPDGTMGNFWASESDKQEFERRVQKVVEHYNKIQLQNGQYVNGEKTKIENTADIVGLNAAYEAYCKYLSKNGYKGEQLKLQKKRFFIGYAHLFHSKYTDNVLADRLKADTHSPYPARINGAVAQIDDWYELFDVKEGDKLYLAPEDRIRIW